MVNKRTRGHSSKLRSKIVLDGIIIFYSHCIAFGHFELDKSLNSVILKTVS